MADVTASTEDTWVDWFERRDAVLRHLAGRRVDKLGEGEEAEVYALDAEQVVRLFKPHVDPAYIARRHAFYAGLDVSSAPYAVPSAGKQGREHGIFYSVDGRVPGSSLVGVLPHLTGEARRTALLAYADASAHVRNIEYAQSCGFGELIAASALRAATWADYLLAKAEACLAKSRSRLTGEISRPEQALDTMRCMLSRHGSVVPHLVHGDFYPANVMVAPDGRVTGVIDFGPLTLIGDWRLDAASALLYLIGMEGITDDDRYVVHTRLMDLGLLEEDVELYRLFYAILFLDTGKAGLFAWCRETVRAASEG